jgi:hypothetical protein
MALPKQTFLVPLLSSTLRNLWLSPISILFTMYFLPFILNFLPDDGTVLGATSPGPCLDFDYDRSRQP